MLYLMTEIGLLLFVAVLLGVLVGWLLWGRQDERRQSQDGETGPRMAGRSAASRTAVLGKIGEFQAVPTKQPSSRRPQANG